NSGAFGQDGLQKAARGKHYGTTVYGGTGGCSGNAPGCGTIYRIAKDGTETVLYSFQGGSDGAIPYSHPIADRAGNLYGTTGNGGSNDYGTIYKLAPDGTETILHAFTSQSDGANPTSVLVRDAAGNLFGTALVGGV